MIKARAWWGIWLWLAACAAHADDGILVVRTVQSTLINKVFILNAHAELRLGDKAVEALHRGIPLVVVYDIEVHRPRDYLWNESVAVLTQRFQISYQVLTKQYLVKNFNSGVQNSFPSLRTALDVLGNLVDLPLLDQALLDKDLAYTARLRVRLDIDALPTPLRLQAYLFSSWRQESEWYAWPLQ